MTENGLIDEVGMVMASKIHDGNLFGILMPDPRTLLIMIQTSERSNICLRFSDVERFRMDDFRQGNVILDITVWRGAEVRREDVAYAYGESSEGAPFLEDAVRRISAEDKLVVQLNPSFGASAVCICGGVAVEGDWIPLVAAGSWLTET